MTHQSRREFCAQACHVATAGALAGALGTVLDGCSGGGGNGSLPSNVPTLPTIAGTPTSGGVSVTVAGSPLASVGSAALVQSSSGVFLVARTGQDTFSALTSTCTHQTCTIIGFTGDAFVCPCHGSRFSTTGAVQNGPANRPLRSFATRFDGTTLVISA